MGDNKGRAFTGICYVSDAGNLTDLPRWLLQIPCILSRSCPYAPLVVQKEYGLEVSKNEPHSIYKKKELTSKLTDE